MIIFPIMSNIKRFFSVTLMAFFIVSASFAQDAGGTASDGGTQRQVRMDLNRFRTVYGSDGLEMRKKILNDIGEAVKQGNTNDEIYAALEYMSMEGLKNRSMERGRIQNDYPQIRADVAEQLGKIGTEKAAEILIQQCRNEQNEQYNILEKIINALGDIGINENGATVKNILWRVRVYNPAYPDTSVERVIAPAIYALYKIEKKNDGFKNEDDLKDVQTFLDRVNKGHFTRPVQDYAKKVLEEILRRDAERRQGT